MARASVSGNRKLNTSAVDWDIQSKFKLQLDFDPYKIRNVTKPKNQKQDWYTVVVIMKSRSKLWRNAFAGWTDLDRIQYVDARSHAADNEIKFKTGYEIRVNRWFVIRQQKW